MDDSVTWLNEALVVSELETFSEFESVPDTTEDPVCVSDESAALLLPVSVKLMVVVSCAEGVSVNVPERDAFGVSDAETVADGRSDSVVVSVPSNVSVMREYEPETDVVEL